MRDMISMARMFKYGGQKYPHTHLSFQFVEIFVFFSLPISCLHFKVHLLSFKFQFSKRRSVSVLGSYRYLLFKKSREEKEEDVMDEGKMESLRSQVASSSLLFC
jgi:hypothetical protein